MMDDNKEMIEQLMASWSIEASQEYIEKLTKKRALLNDYLDVARRVLRKKIKEKGKKIYDTGGRHGA